MDQLTIVDSAALTERLTKGTSPEIRSWWETEIAGRIRFVEISDSLSALKSQITNRLREKDASLGSLIDAEDKIVTEKELALREKTQASAEEELARGRREQSKRRFDMATAKRSEYLVLFAEFEALLAQRNTTIRQLETTQDSISDRTISLARCAYATIK